MRKSIRAIATALAIILTVPSINVGAYTFNKKEDNDVYEVSDIKHMDMIREASVSDLTMLNDIVERAYNNDFKKKSYIIKNKSEDLGRFDEDGYDLWGNYVLSRGDTYIATTFTEKAVAKDGDDYYHSVSVTSKPAWDSGATMSNGFKCIDAFNRESRSIEKDYWDDYMKGIEDAEKEIGFTENNDLCDFQLILQTYIWIKDNVHESSSSTRYRTGGQTAIEGMLDKSAACAGQSRLFNRFMHDFGIDSYWINNPNIAHAWNLVKFKNKDEKIIFGEVDCQGTNYDDTTVTGSNYCDYHILTPVGQEAYYMYINSTPLISSILYYDPDFINTSEKSRETIEIKGVTSSIKLPKFTTEDDTTYTQNADCPYCAHFGKTIQHSFKTGELSSKRVVKDTDNNIPNAGIDVYDNRFNYDTGDYYKDHLEIIKGNETVTEINEAQTTKEPTTTTEPVTTTSSSVEEPTTASNNIEPVTTVPGNEDATTAKNEEPTKNNDVVVPTTNNVPDAVEPITTTKSDSRTSVTTTSGSNEKSAPSIPANIKAKNVKKKSIKLMWRKTLDAKKYQVQYSTKSNFKKSVTKTTTKLKYIIKKLKKGKTYYIRLRAVNGKKISNWSKVKKIKIKK